MILENNYDYIEQYERNTLDISRYSIAFIAQSNILKIVFSRYKASYINIFIPNPYNYILLRIFLINALDILILTSVS